MFFLLRVIKRRASLTVYFVLVVFSELSEVISRSLMIFNVFDEVKTYNLIRKKKRVYELFNLMFCSKAVKYSVMSLKILKVFSVIA